MTRGAEFKLNMGPGPTAGASTYFFASNRDIATLHNRPDGVSPPLARPVGDSNLRDGKVQRRSIGHEFDVAGGPGTASESIGAQAFLLSGALRVPAADADARRKPGRRVERIRFGWDLVARLQQNPNIEPGARVTYELSATGEAQYRSVVRFSISEAVESIVQIEQATILDERKIKTVIRPLKITTAAGAETRPFYFRKQEIVTEKIGSKNHVLSNHFVDESAYVIIDNGKMRNGQQMPLLEKCTD